MTAKVKPSEYIHYKQRRVDDYIKRRNNSISTACGANSNPKKLAGSSINCYEGLRETESLFCKGESIIYSPFENKPRAAKQKSPQHEKIQS